MGTRFAAVLPQWRRAEIGPRRTSTPGTVSQLETPQWRRAEIGPRSGGSLLGVVIDQEPQWRRAEIGPRSSWLRGSRDGRIEAAMEEGRDRPSEGSRRSGKRPSAGCRNGGGPRSALGELAFYCGVDLGVRATSASGWFGGLVVAASIWLSRCLKPKSIRLASGPWHWRSDLTSRIR